MIDNIIMNTLTDLLNVRGKSTSLVTIASTDIAQTKKMISIEITTASNIKSRL